METVEDTLEPMHLLRLNRPSVFARALPGPWYERFVSNVRLHALDNKPLSTEQVRIILKLLARLRPHLIEHRLASAESIDRLLRHPVYRRQPYQSSSIPREVRHIGDNCLAFRFKYNDVIVDAIKGLRKKSDYFADELTRFDHATRVWIVRVTRDTLDPIFKIVNDHRFQFDEATLDYLTLASNSKGQPSTFVFDPESGKIVANVCDNEIIANWVRNVLRAEVL